MTNTVLNENDLKAIFEEAHTTRAWTDKTVDPAVIKRAYDHVKWAPTAYNVNPLRILNVAGAPARTQLLELAMEGNRPSLSSAPTVLVLAWDPNYIDAMAEAGAPEYLTEMLRAADWAPSLAPANAWIQAGYLILTLRALGLDVHPMTGADLAGVDEKFLGAEGWKSYLILATGYAAPDSAAPRSPRFGYEQISKEV